MWPQFNSCFSYLSLLSILLQGKPTVPVDQAAIWNHFFLCLLLYYSRLSANPPSSAFWMSPYIRPFISSCSGSCSVASSRIAAWLFPLPPPPPKRNVWPDFHCFPHTLQSSVRLDKLCKTSCLQCTTSVLTTLDMPRHSLDSNTQSLNHDLNCDLRELDSYFFHWSRQRGSQASLEFPGWAKYTLTASFLIRCCPPPTSFSLPGPLCLWSHELPSCFIPVEKPTYWFPHRLDKFIFPPVVYKVPPFHNVISIYCVCFLGDCHSDWCNSHFPDG